MCNRHETVFLLFIKTYIVSETSLMLQPSVDACKSKKRALAMQSEPENKAANPSLPLAEACGRRLPLNREAWLGSVQRGIPHTERTRWVWPPNSWFLRGPLPKHCATCQRPRAPVSLTKATTNYPRHVSRPAFSKELPLQEPNKQFPEHMHQNGLSPLLPPSNNSLQ